MTTSTTKTCPTCHKQIPSESVYCMYCGKRTDSSPQKHRRGNGQGTAYKTGTTWTAEITTGWELIDGKAVRKRRRKYGFKTKRDALAYLQTLKNAPESSLTLSDIYAVVSKEFASRSRIDAYATAWKRIEPILGSRDITSLSVAELQRLVDSSTEQPHARKNIKILLSKFYDYAMRLEVVDRNRARLVKIDMPETEKTREVFTEQEIQHIWSIWQQQPEYISACVLIMLYTGMRPGEIRQLDPQNVHIDEHYLTGGIKTRKGKNRKIIIPDKIVPVLQWLLDNYLTCSRNTFLKWFNAFRERHGLRQELEPYSCRHTYVTRLTALKVSPAMLQELVGHEDYDTTLIYTHLSVEDRLAEVNRLS